MLPQFTVDVIKFCSMHIVNLGVDLWLAGSTFRVLLMRYPPEDVWLGSTETARLATAHVEFKQWARSKKLQYHVLISVLRMFVGQIKGTNGMNHQVAYFPVRLGKGESSDIINKLESIQRLLVEN